MSRQQHDRRGFCYSPHCSAGDPLQAAAQAMTNLADEARQFWSAALFHRRAPGRDRSTAVRIIRRLTTSPIGRIAGLAQSMLKEIENERTDKN